MKFIDKNIYFKNKFHYKFLNNKYLKTYNNKNLFNIYLNNNKYIYNNMYFNEIEFKFHNLNSIFFLGFNININYKKKISNYFSFYNKNYFLIYNVIYIYIHIYNIILFLLLFKFIYIINFLKK